MVKALFAAILLAAMLAIGCATYDAPQGARVDPSSGHQDFTSGFTIEDILEVVPEMRADMMSSPILLKRIQEGEQDPNKIPRIVILPVVNNTRFRMTPGTFVNRMRSELNKQVLGKIFFIAREDLDASLSEQQLRNQESTITDADYFLTGTIDGITTAGSRGGTRESYLYNVRLTDTRNQIIVWENNYAISKVTQERMINR